MAKHCLPLLVLWLFAQNQAAAQSHRNRGDTEGLTYKHSVASPIFTPISTPMPGVDYSAVAWGDYDNDGSLDILLTGLISSNNLISKIYRNQGGTFQEIVTTIAGTAQSDVAWGDFDNDNDLDLLVCGDGGKIYRNDQGNFVDLLAPIVAVTSGAVADWGDFDNDGDLDILLAGRSTNTIAKVYRNNQGNFVDFNATLKGVSTGSGQWGDYDNDDDMDILLTGFHENGIYVTAIYANNNGIFSDKAANLPEVALGAGAWGDYDDDGDLDILLAGLTPALRRVATVYRNEAGNFIDISAALDTLEDVAAAWGDCDNDGDLDIVMAGYINSTSVARLYQNNEGAFVGIDAGLRGVVHGAVAWGDYDHDGDLDILLAGNASNTDVPDLVTILYRNDGAPQNTPPLPPAQLEARVAHNTVILSWGQASDDHTPAQGLTYNVRIGTAPAGNQIMSAMADPGNGLRKIPQFGNVNHNRSWVIRDLPPGQYYWSVQAVDHSFTGSIFAKEEVFTITATNQPPVVINPVPDLSVTLNDEPLTRNLYAPPTVFADADGDSILYVAQSLAPEIAQASVVDGILTITPVGLGMVTITLVAQDQFAATEQISFTVSVLGETAGPFTDVAAWLPGVAGSSAWGDYDSDGDLDVLLTGATSTEYDNFISKIFRNDNGFFVDSGNDLLGVHGGAVAWGDYDNDDDLDILLAGWTEDAFHSDAPRATKIYRNDDGSFVDTMADLIDMGGGAVDWGDYDNDGDLDILLTGLSRVAGAVTKIYRNDGADTFMDANAALDPMFRSAAVWGDYDNDSDLDILLTGESRGAQVGARTKIYRNDAGNFVDVPTILKGYYDSAAAWGDYNNDGDLDILISGLNGLFGNETKIYQNNGTTFTDLAVALAAVDEGTVAWGDHDNDGDLDVLLGRVGLIYRNDNGRFVNISAGLPGSPIGTTNFGRGGALSWGDYDNDGDLDLLLTDFCNIIVFRPPSLVGVPTACSKVYRNDAPKPNRAPTAPAGLAPTVSDSSASLSWGQAQDDKTPSAGLTYNLRLGLTPGGGEIVSPMAGATTGYRRVPEFGNMGHTTQWKIVSLSRGKYYWSVQAIDPALGSSTFAAEDSFLIQPESAVVAPFALDFNEVQIGMARDTVLSLINRSADNLTVSDVHIAGAQALHFSYLGDTSFFLPGGEQRPLHVRFQPQSPGGQSARLMVYHNGPGGYSFATLIGTGVDQSSPVIIAVTAPSSIPLHTALTVSTQVSDDYVLQTVRLLYRQGGEASFASADMSLETSSNYVFTLPETIAGSRGIEFDIEATDGINAPTRAGWRSVRVLLPDKSLSRVHAGGSSQQVYHLVSIPLDSDDPLVASTLLDDLGPADSTRWRLWDIDPLRANSLSPYREYPDADNLGPGRAKFLITSETKNLTSGAGATLATTAPFELQLHSGWNMIACPFNFDIPVANVYPESLRTHLYTYTGAWRDSLQFLQPWEGYVIKAMQPVTLKIWPSEGVGDSLSRSPKSMFALDWSIRLDATCAHARDASNTVGVARDAALAWDRHERFEPPPIGEYIMLAFPHREWQNYADTYTTDYRPPVADGHIWDFTVDTNISSKPVTICCANLNSVPAEFDVLLVDLQLKLTQDLRREPSYVYLSKSNGGKRSFQLLAGKSDFIAAHGADLTLVPASYELAQNFPNPFNPSTSIKLGLPQKSRVSLKVYNLLGTEIATMVDGEEKEAGYHVVIWDGRDRQGRLAPGGIYFCRMQVGNIVLMKKMTFIK
ncbi:MAG: FG-GAP-like repeat-containing protein [bacterium]